MFFLLFQVTYRTGRHKLKGPPFQFFWHCETFFRKTIFPFSFLMFCDRMDVKKCKRLSWLASSVVWVFREFDTFFVSLILWVLWDFHVLLLFLSLRYGADSCRSRLVEKYRSHGRADYRQRLILWAHVLSVQFVIQLMTVSILNWVKTLKVATLVCSAEIKTSTRKAVLDNFNTSNLINKLKT